MKDNALLQEFQTSANGTYEIKYLPKREAGSDLLVQILSKDGEVVATSPLILEAAHTQTVDLVVHHDAYPPETELAELQKRIKPFLGNKNPATLDRETVGYLAGKSLTNPVHIAFWVQANRLAKEIGMDVAEAFYGMFRSNLPTSLPALVGQDADAQKKAVEAAIVANIIDEKVAKQLDKVLDKLAKQNVDQLLETPDTPAGTASLGHLLQVAGISEDQKRTFATTFAKHNSTSSAFFEDLTTNGFDAQSLSSVKLSIQLGALTQNHAPLMKSLHERLQPSGQGLRELVGRNLPEWLQDIRLHTNADGTVIVPPDLPEVEGESPDETYARLLAEKLEATFPTPTILATLGAQDFAGARTVRAFLTQHDVEFRNTNLRKFLRDQNVTLSDAEREEVFAFKRIFDLAPEVNRYRAMKPLLRDGVRSAYAIRRMGEQGFMRRYADELGETTARHLYKAASQKSAMATALFAAHSPMLNNVGLHVLPQDNPGEILTKLEEEGAVDSVDLPTWESLFGSMSFCACEHCRSVYSPAAYLVDILAFLRQQKTNEVPALDMLFDRRGDIGKIELTCHNTNTVLPYVDLVIEVLERYVAHEGRKWWEEVDVPQTLGEAEDLRVYPENLTTAAYDVLKSMAYPWTLPFSLPTAETRAYLEPLGVKRDELMRVFTAHPEEALPVNLRTDIAAEHLGLIPRARDIILGPAGGGAEGWGGAAIEDLRQVKLLMDRGQLSFYEVRQLLDTTTINPDGELEIEFPEDDLCDLNRATIPALQLTPHAVSIHRFMRLQRKIGWSIHELDAAIEVLSDGQITAELLRRLSVVKQLHDSLNVPLLSLLSWWGLIDTTRIKDEHDEEQPSFYDTLFLNKTIGNNEELQAFALNEARNELANPNQRLDEVKAFILAALNLRNAEELDLILEKRLLINSLTLGNLSKIYRVVSLARVLKLSIRDLLSLIDLTDFDPFVLSTLEDLPRLFLDVLERFKTSGFSIPEVAYLVFHDFEPDSIFARGDEAISDFLFKLRSGLRKIQQTHQFAPDPSGERTAQLLAQVVSEEEMTKAMVVIAGIPDSEIPGDQPTPLAREAIVDNHFGIFLDDVQAMKGKLIQGVSTTDFLNPTTRLAERFQEILKPLLIFLQKTHSVALVKQSFAEFLGLDLRASDQLVGDLIKAVSDPALPASAEFLDDAFIKSVQEELREQNFTEQFQVVRRLQKIAALLKNFDIPSEEARWLVEESPQLGWLDLNALPVDTLDQDPARFQAWLRMAQFAWLRNNLPANAPSLFELIRIAHTGADEDGNAVTKNDFLDQLHAGTGWNLIDLDTLLNATHFNLAFNGSFTGEQTLEQLLKLYRSVKLLQRLGVSAEIAWEWTSPLASLEVANEVKQAVRAKFEEGPWLAVAEPIRDALRLKQRSSLVDASLEIVKEKHPDLDVEEAEDLFGFFLMDVEMSPCMLTSRIKQAISSVQLFVQRCLMNLEPEVTFEPEAAEQWKWMKNYRVWEANRKVFLYPENYLEPELRPEKSPFFVDLENELLQNDVTKDTAELAFLNYLEKLDEVARLEVASIYHDEEDKTLYVLGRTKNIPRKYFYRRWERQRRWTPWEPVSVDIEGENVAITLFNGRLYLFWFMTQEKADDTDNSEVKVPDVGEDPFASDKPKKYLEIKLAWSQYRSGQWSSKQLSDVAVRTKFGRIPIRRKIYFPRPISSQESEIALLIAVEQVEQDLFSAFNLSDRPAIDEFQFPNIGEFDLPAGIQGDSTLRTSRLNDSNLRDNNTGFQFGIDGQVSLNRQNEILDLPFPTRSYFQEGGLNGKGLPFARIRPVGFLRIRMRNGHYATALGDAPSYRVVAPVQFLNFISQAPLLYEDEARSYLIVPRHSVVLGLEADDMVVVRAFSEPDEPIIPPFNNPGIVSGLGVIGRSSRLENVLVARNIHDTSLATRVVGETRGASRRGLLGNMLAAPALPLVSAAIGNGVQPFVLDLVSLSVAAGILESGATDRVVNIPSSLITKFCFHNFYHPYVGVLITQLNRHGIDGLFIPIEAEEGADLRRQQKREDIADSFDRVYALGPAFDRSNIPVEEFDFTYTGSYAHYNWELFFHAPLLIAARLSANQQFEEAQKWFHYIFEPTAIDISTLEDEERPFRFWKTKPFFENRGLDNIRTLLDLLSSDDPKVKAKRAAFEVQIADWRDNPFQPHLIAQQRIVAYQKATVMKYIDNLIAWGDHLFRRDSIESINEATQLYVLAAQILGRRPELVLAPAGEATINNTPVKTFDDLALHLDAFGNALVQIETELSSPTELPDVPHGEAPVTDILGNALFFCIPRNDKLLGYWDMVADRLFKIRHCMNIEGVVRQLALFEPPIDPALLVRAAAAGIDINSVLTDMNAPRLNYRYAVLLQKAIELCNEVKQLGGALLAALEKRDAETLTLLRSGHEERLLKAIKSIRELQLNESAAGLAGLQKNLETVQGRHNFYLSRERRSQQERLQSERLTQSNILELGVASISLVKQAMAAIGDFTIGSSGFGGSPVITTENGSTNFIQGLNAVSENASILARFADRSSNMASIQAGLNRRDEEWDFQVSQAATEIEALEKQIEGANLRIAIAEHDLGNLELQIEQNREADEFMRSKFTNQELYSWMISQVSTIYFQSYQLGYDMAKKAQRAFQFELADFTTTFIDFGYWDSLKKGLLAGEQLHYDLRRMESAYFEANRREYELTKHISLLQLNPASLVQLQETGLCEIDIPEVLFDLDYPGHFLRRIKAVSLSIPCVTGPYTTVNCTLTLLNNRVRNKTDRPGDPFSGLGDDRFLSDVGGVQSIATSSAREDSGVFEFTFRDERYLPFEGAGAIGRWRLELPSDYRQFDYRTIADVVLHMRYTAREGGETFKAAVKSEVDASVNQLVEAANKTGIFHFLSMKHEFGTEFHQFLHPAGIAEHSTTLTLSKQHFPFLFQGKNIGITNVIVFVTLRNASLYSNNNPLVLAITRPGSAQESEPLLTAGPKVLGDLALATYTHVGGDITNDEAWVFTIKDADVQSLPPALRETITINGVSVDRIKPEEIEDFGMLFQYEVS